MTAILPVPLGYFFFHKDFWENCFKEFFVGLPTAVALTPVACSRVATKELAGPRDSDPGSVMMYFTLWMVAAMVAIRGVGREEFVASL
jgi:hypothetical protein